MANFFSVNCHENLNINHEYISCSFLLDILLKFICIEHCSSSNTGGIYSIWKEIPQSSKSKAVRQHRFKRTIDSTILNRFIYNQNIQACFKQFPGYKWKYSIWYILSSCLKIPGICEGNVWVLFCPSVICHL